MTKTFRAKKMLDRLEREGRMHEVRPEDYALMMFLDGKEGSDYNYQSFVHDQPLVWIAGGGDFEGKPFKGAYVNTEDCD